MRTIFLHLNKQENLELKSAIKLAGSQCLYKFRRLQIKSKFFFIGDGHLFQSMLECSMISRSDTSGESGCRGNGNMSLDPANSDPNVQKYACARCGRSYLHQVRSAKQKPALKKDLSWTISKQINLTFFFWMVLPKAFFSADLRSCETLQIWANLWDWSVHRH